MMEGKPSSLKGVEELRKGLEVLITAGLGLRVASLWSPATGAAKKGIFGGIVRRGKETKQGVTITRQVLCMIQMHFWSLLQALKLGERTGCWTQDAQPICARTGRVSRNIKHAMRGVLGWPTEQLARLLAKGQSSFVCQMEDG
jgi:hypothetical protein